MVKQLLTVFAVQKEIWPSVAPMSLQLWEGYFLRWVQVGAVTTNIAESRRISEIIARNKEARTQAVRLRRELEHLLEEANMMGLVTRGQEGQEGEEAVSTKQTQES